MNGQQYSSGGPTFTYEDSWHSPAVTGAPPSGRHGMAPAVVDSVMYIFGGEEADLNTPSEGFLGDMYALHLDMMRDFYPSETARDLTWQTLSLMTGGDPPTARSYHSLLAWGRSLLLFGGSSSINGAMHNTTYEFSIARSLWQPVTVSGGPVSPRSGHTAVLCSLAVGCSPSDGRPRMVVFGGWGLEPCGATRPCLAHRNDLLALELNSMAWAALPVNTEQPLPWARKGHTASLVNGSLMVVFGGSAWVPDPDADNSYGYSTRHVNDLWAIDLSGESGYTWQEAYHVGDAPSPREGHVATVVADRYIVVHGGYSHSRGFLNETFVLDTAVDPMVWSRPSISGTMPTSRQGHVAVNIGDNEILTFGGMGTQGYSNDLHIFQLAVGNEALYPALATAP